jgi:hypothetical protein
MVVGASLVQCCNKTKTVATLDDPLPIKWEYQRRFTGGGRLGGLSESGIITVQQKPSVSFDAGCWEPHPELAATKEAVAYRCEPSKPWSLAYLAKSGPYALPYCGSVLGSGPRPDFAHMPALPAVAPRLLHCLLNEVTPAPSHVYREVKLRGGDAALGKLLLQASDFSYPPFPELAYEDRKNSKAYDGWELGYELLSAAARKKLDAGLRERLEQERPPLDLIRRALWHVPSLDTDLKPVYLARAKQLVGAPAEAELVLVVLLARLALLHADQVGALACDILERAPARSYPGGAYEVGVLQVLALTRTHCEGVTQRLDQNWCRLGYDCGSDKNQHLCTQAELDQKIPGKVRARALDRNGWRHTQQDWPHALLAASYAQGSLPARVTLAAKRRHYAVLPDTPCFKAKPDQSCDCFASEDEKQKAVCTLDGGTHGTLPNRCRMVIDDKRKGIITYSHELPEDGRPKPRASTER